MAPWLLLDTGLFVQVLYERDFVARTVKVSFMAERKPTTPEIREAYDVLQAVLDWRRAFGWGFLEKR
jgi:hypothetical protein